jgi:hypothetical protein
MAPPAARRSAAGALASNGGATHPRAARAVRRSTSAAATDRSPACRSRPISADSQDPGDQNVRMRGGTGATSARMKRRRRPSHRPAARGDTGLCTTDNITSTTTPTFDIAGVSTARRLISFAIYHPGRYRHSGGHDHCPDGSAPSAHAHLHRARRSRAFRPAVYGPERDIRHHGATRGLIDLDAKRFGHQ